MKLSCDFFVLFWCCLTFEEIVIKACQPKGHVFKREERALEFEITSTTSVEAIILKNFTAISNPPPYVVIKDGVGVPENAKVLATANITEIPVLNYLTEKNASWAVGAMLDNGFYVDATDNFNTTALQIACKNGNLEVAELLLRAGADINFYSQFIETPLRLIPR